MSTHAVLTVFDEYTSEPLVHFYSHWDGYPSGFGKNLYNFLKDFTIVNGLSSDQNEKVANGMGCLAAQIIAHFKIEPGNFYILYECENHDYEFNYELEFTDELRIRVLNYNKTLFSGTIPEFGKYLKVPCTEE